MPTLDVNGVSLAYHDSGGAGRAFVLVHGFTGNQNDFEDHLDALHKLGRTVLYDHRGHGESTNTGNPEHYTFEQLSADLLAVLDALGIESCDLLGHSMGGMVVLRFALAHPDRVRSLVLMDTSSRVPDRFVRSVFSGGGEVARSEGMAKLAEIARSLAEKDPNRPRASREYEKQIGSKSYWERHVRRMTGMDPEAFAMLGVAMSDQEPVTDRLGEIACPTTVLVGIEDLPFIEPSKELANGIPGAELIKIAEAAHSPQLENPKEWIEAIEAHLKRARATD